MVTVALLFLCIGVWSLGEVTTTRAKQRSLPSVEKGGLQLQIRDWQGGKVGYSDHSNSSARYDWELEWQGPAGERVELLKVGNVSPPHYEIAEDKSLKISNWEGHPIIFDSPTRKRE